MAIEMEGQTPEEHQQIKTREIQKESVEKLEAVTDMVDNFNIDIIESDTQVIKDIVMSNLEEQTNIDDVADALDKVIQGITDIKRSQTNLNKKINEIQKQIGD
ncbi:MAG: hypothetical protein J6B87_07430 [Clostridia bacterium]|nr:hypothetical protein [Clostridia bacterium]